MAQPSNLYRAKLARALNEGGSETIIYVDRITNLLGETIAFSDFADFGRGVLTINPDGDGLSSFPEYDSFTGISGNTFTGVTRGLSARSNTASSSLARFHPVDTPVVISFGAHNIQDLLDYVDAGIATAVVGTANATVATAGETIAAGEVVYLHTDGKWYKCDADTAGTVQGIQLGIAQGAGTTNNAITNGVVLRGRDTNQTGLVAGTAYYVSNTAGGLSSSAGTTPRIIGVALSSTVFLFDPYYSYTLTDDQQDALAGDGGTPSVSNKYLTQNRSVTAGETINGATTPVPIFQNTTDNEFYACDGNDTAKLKFLGFAVSNSTDGNAMRAQFGGVVGGFTGLDEGVPYYLSDTVGTIQNTPGTYSVQVGVAISTTQLLIQPGRRRAAGNGGSLGTASGSLAVTCGFRPSIIRIRARGASTTFINTLDFTYVNGAISAVSAHYNEGSSNGTSNSAILYEDDASNDYMTFTISGVTSTGFTVEWTETGTFATGSASFYWEAEGDF